MEWQFNSNLNDKRSFHMYSRFFNCKKDRNNFIKFNGKCHNYNKSNINYVKYYMGCNFLTVRALHSSYFVSAFCVLGVGAEAL